MKNVFFIICYEVCDGGGFKNIEIFVVFQRVVQLFVIINKCVRLKVYQGRGDNENKL